MWSTKPVRVLRKATWRARLAPGLVLFATLVHGDELLYFKNGFTLAALSHLQRDALLEVQVGTGTLVFPADEVSRIEILTAVKNPGQPVADATKTLPPEKLLLQQVSPEKLLYDAAVAQGVDAAFVRSVAVVESGLRQERISPKGAVGLMQLMPATARELGVDASQTDQNARGGVQYLRALLLKYDGDSALALAAYNAGPGAVRKFQGVPPYRETRQYVLSVIKEYNRQLQAQAAAKPSSAAAKKSSKPSATD